MWGSAFVEKEGDQLAVAPTGGDLGGWVGGWVGGEKEKRWGGGEKGRLMGGWVGEWVGGWEDSLTMRGVSPSLSACSIRGGEEGGWVGGCWRRRAAVSSCPSRQARRRGDEPFASVAVGEAPDWRRRWVVEQCPPSLLSMRPDMEKREGS